MAGKVALFARSVNKDEKSMTTDQREKLFLPNKRIPTKPKLQSKIVI
jgi:hypothetical protein